MYQQMTNQVLLVSEGSLAHDIRLVEVTRDGDLNYTIIDQRKIILKPARIAGHLCWKAVKVIKFKPVKPVTPPVEKRKRITEDVIIMTNQLVGIKPGVIINATITIERDGDAFDHLGNKVTLYMGTLWKAVALNPAKPKRNFKPAEQKTARYVKAILPSGLPTWLLLDRSTDVVKGHEVSADGSSRMAYVLVEDENGKFSIDMGLTVKSMFGGAWMPQS